MIDKEFKKYSVPAAHIRKEWDENGKEIIVDVETIKEHSEKVAGLAKEFADCFGGGEVAALCGLAHDIGKYSNKSFQKLCTILI